MTTANTLPWDDAGTTVANAVSGDLHARATGLATAAMEAAAAAPAGDPADTDYGRACADYDRRLAAIRAETARGHVEANNRRAVAAAAARAERVAAHAARNAEAQAKAKRRKLDAAA